MNGIAFDGLFPFPRRVLLIGQVRHDDILDRQVVFFREGEITRVVRRDGHHRAGTVITEHIIRDEHRHFLTVCRIDRHNTFEPNAGLLAPLRRPLHLGLLLRLLDIRMHFLPISNSRFLLPIPCSPA